jgi:hypothetical protein
VSAARLLRRPARPSAPSLSGDERKLPPRSSPGPLLLLLPPLLTTSGSSKGGSVTELISFILL